MISLTLVQAKSIIRYSFSLLFVPLVVIGWWPHNRFVVSGAFVVFGLMVTWRDSFAHKVITAEIMSDVESSGDYIACSSDHEEASEGFGFKT
jgi:hypothetical protein